MSQLKVGILGGSGGQELKGLVAQRKEKVPGASQPRRGMLSRAARVKVWEERIEEEEEEEELVREEEMESLRVQEQLISKGKSRGTRMQMRAQYVAPRGGSNTKASEEIGVFDAERYFGGAEQPAGWAREEEDELMEGEAGGDLPLSPLVEFGKGQWRLRDGLAASAAHGKADHNTRRGTPSWTAAAATTPGSSFGRRRVECTEFTSPGTSTASSLSEVEPPLQRTTTAALLNSAPAHGAQYAAGGKHNLKSKVQPASPSGRLASFLAKFKAPTPRKSPASSPIQHLKPATTSTSTPAPPPRRPAPPVLSPAKKLFPQYSLGLLPPQAKISSPRGRFLRAFSSSSADNTASAAALRYHSNSAFHAATPPSMAASSPVSPAARSVPDPYSPIAHSASTTPTSSKLPKSSVHSVSHHGSKYYTSSRSKPDSAAPGRCNSSGSFKHQLPFLSRKLKVYLMPDKVGPGKHETPAGKSAAQGLDFVHHGRHMEGSKQRRRWLHAEDQVVDEDIELAERLLRVVQDHQSIGGVMSQHSKSSLANQAINNGGIGGQFNKSSNHIKSLHVDRVSEYSSRKYDQMHPANSSSTATSNLVQISSHGDASVHNSNGVYSRAAEYFMSNSNMQAQLPAAKDQEASLYDSDSSSDLFEIETLACVGMGLYRRDLPVYEAKEPFPNHTFSFASSRPAR